MAFLTDGIITAQKQFSFQIIKITDVKISSFLLNVKIFFYPYNTKNPALAGLIIKHEARNIYALGSNTLLITCITPLL